MKQIEDSNIFGLQIIKRTCIDAYLNVVYTSIPTEPPLIFKTVYITKRFYSTTVTWTLTMLDGMLRKVWERLVGVTRHCTENGV